MGTVEYDVVFVAHHELNDALAKIKALIQAKLDEGWRDDYPLVWQRVGTNYVCTKELIRYHLDGNAVNDAAAFGWVVTQTGEPCLSR